MLSGLVLAGGRSARMGREKALLPLPDGRTLLQRQIDLLRAVGAGSVNVSVGPGKVFPLTGAGAISDAVPDAGPLAGIAAGLRAAPPGLVLVLAVDMPGIGEAHLRRLVELATAGCGVVPVREGRCESLVAVYPATLAASAEAWLAGGQSAPHAWVRHEAAQGHLMLWEAPADWAAALRSWNSPGDLPK
jgi:molybdopterin-guanine dinucleotide biosynthesis protein A